MNLGQAVARMKSGAKTIFFIMLRKRCLFAYVEHRTAL